MVKYKIDSLSDIFHALADQTRRRILFKIAKKQHKVTELAKPFAMSLPAISKHLKVLEKAKLLKRTKDGRIHHCQMNIKPLGDVEHLLKHYSHLWQNQKESLDQYSEKVNFIDNQNPWPFNKV